MHPSGKNPLSRRGFLVGGALGLTAGAGAAVWGSKRLAETWRRLEVGGFSGQPAEVAQPTNGMPGRYPGKVVEVRHPRAVSHDNVIDRSAVSGMVDHGMATLTGCDPRDVKASWGRFFEKDDVVGIKVNPVGRKPLPGEDGRVAHAVGVISSHELLVKVVRCLQELGLPAKNIIVFERYASEFCEAGYADLIQSELPGVRWYAASVGYSPTQLDLSGIDDHRGRVSAEVLRHVVGYDPDVFVSMGFCQPEHSPRDDRRFRSHLSTVVTRLCSKIITLPVLKDHRSAGVTLSLKNMSHGMNNNVARSHTGGPAHTMGAGSDRVTGPNQCNTFIPTAVAQPELRAKATLHILDGLIGTYEGGPGSWNKTWATWRHQGIFFATDPVALDHVGWDVVDAKRVAEGWAPVGRMGLVYQTPGATVASGLAPLGSTGLDAANLAAAAINLHGGRDTEVFNLRQPDHIVLAGLLGLGRFPRDEIQHQVVQLG
jgi:hypothetical protein